MSPVEAFIVLRLVRLLSRLPSVILANLVLGENVIPEFLQSDCTLERLAEALLPLLQDTPQRQRQIAAFGRLDAIMAIGSEAPSDKAAAIVLDVAQQHGQRDPAALSASSQPC
jgi:lipid-A-disaccharide synthase